MLSSVLRVASAVFVCPDCCVSQRMSSSLPARWFGLHALNLRFLVPSTSRCLKRRSSAQGSAMLSIGFAAVGGAAALFNSTVGVTLCLHTSDAIPCVRRLKALDGYVTMILVPRPALFLSTLHGHFHEQATTPTPLLSTGPCPAWLCHE